MAYKGWDVFFKDYQQAAHFYHSSCHWLAALIFFSPPYRCGCRMLHLQDQDVLLVRTAKAKKWTEKIAKRRF